LAISAFAAPANEDVVFRSGVSLVRVDVRATEPSGRVIPGLTKEDFEIRDEGRVRPIRNFAAEDMPVDLVLLIDVSTSMRPHVEKVAAAMNDALEVLGPEDRVAFMVFDRRVRTRDRFLARRQEIESAMDRLLREESFRGGTDITYGINEAIRFIARDARKDARRAIVIVTDDYTERNRDVEGLSQALLDGDIVLEALLAPDAMNQGRRGDPQIDDPFPGGTGGGGGNWPSGGGRWPGGGGSGGNWPGGGSGGSWPGRFPTGNRMPWPTGGGRMPGGVIIGNGGGLQRAGTDQIAEASGGQALPVLDSGSLAESFRQIRQRYALYFSPSEDARAGERRNLIVTVKNRRHASANLHYRPVYVAAGPGERSTGVEEVPTESASNRDARPERSPEGSGGGGSHPPVVTPAKRTPEPPVEATGPASNTHGEPTAQRKGGWRRVKPGEKPEN
jgi:VWFA-related protein